MIAFSDVHGASIIPSLCGGILTNYGELLSPGFPDGYFNNTNCSWSASFSSTYQITVTFNVFNTELTDLFNISVRDTLFGALDVDLYSISGTCFSSHVCPPGVSISFLATEVAIEFVASQFVSKAGFNVTYTISKPSEIPDWYSLWRKSDTWCVA